MGNSVRQSDESAARPRPPIWRASTRSSCGTAESIGMLIYDDDDDDQASAFTSHAREGKETHNAVPHAWQPIEDGLRIRHRSLGPSATASHRVLPLVLFFLFLSQEHRKVKIIPAFAFVLHLPFWLYRRHRHRCRCRCRRRRSWFIGRCTELHRFTLSVITLHFHFFLFLLLLLPVLLLGRRHGCRSRWRWCRPKR